MTFPTRDDQGNVSAGNKFTTGVRVNPTSDPAEWAFEKPILVTLETKPRLDWLLLTVLVADLGVWVGLLAWWIWR